MQTVTILYQSSSTLPDVLAVLVVMGSNRATESSSKEYVLWHNRDSFGMEATEISVFKQIDEESFCRLLYAHDRLRLPS